MGEKRLGRQHNLDLQQATRMTVRDGDSLVSYTSEATCCLHKDIKSTALVLCSLLTVGPAGPMGRTLTLFSSPNHAWPNADAETIKPGDTQTGHKETTDLICRLPSGVKWR